MYLLKDFVVVWVGASRIAIGEIVKLKATMDKLMREHALNVPRLAKLTGISKQTLSNWMAGQKPKNIEQVKVVADHFGVSVDYLCFGEEPKTRVSPLRELDDEINAGVFEVVLRRVKK